MLAQVVVATGEIVAIGMAMLSPDVLNIYIVELREDQLPKLQQLGKWTLDAQGVITVTPIPLPPDPTPIDYGTDITPDRGSLVTAVGLLRAYLALASPTQVQTTTAVKLLIRVVFFVLQRFIS